MKTTELIAVVAVVALGTSAAWAAPEDPVVMPDAALRSVVQEALGITDGRNPTEAQMATLSQLFAEDRGIADLTGIEYAVNLTILNLDNNQIINLSPLSGLTKLTELWLWENQISDISPLSGMAALTSLNLEDNDISDISVVSGMTNLTWLLLNENQITDISMLTGLTNLTVLELGTNQISDISPLAGLTNLTWLGIGGNQISNVSPLSGLTSLTSLGLGGNQIGDISPLAGLTNIAILHLYGNQISDISPLSGLTNLDLLDLTNNPLNWDAHFVYIPMIQAKNPGVNIWYNPYSPPVYFTDANLKQAVKDNLGIVTDPTQAQMATLTYLSANNRGIEDLTGLEYAVNLTWLFLSENQISDISPLAGMANLTQLELSNNQISGISVLVALTNLTYLDLRWNQISDILALSDLTDLTVLLLDGNQISNIGPLSGLAKLDRLSLWENQIGDISPLVGLTNLTMLELCDNQINNISPLSGLTELTWLSLSANQIIDVSPLSGLTNLTDLYLCGNQVIDIIPLAGLINLTFLHLGINQISDVNPLSGLTNLTDLYVGGNQVSDISLLAGLTNLTLLSLHGNQISDISPLSGLTNLDLLDLTNNPLNWDSHFVHIPMIEGNNPGIDIQYDPWVDADSDGVSAAVENGAPNDGDGNDDEIPDGLQDEVASLPNAVDAGYVTLESPEQTDLGGVTATANPSPEPVPEGVEFPIGFFEFTVQGITPAAAITVTLFTSAEVGTYYKYGPTPDNPTDHWYEFLYDGTTGAEILADRVILHLVDGQRGDRDLTANGQIVEPGGPGLSLNTAPVADAGPDQTVEQGSHAGGSVTLDGSGSTDDGQIQPLTYTWTWEGGSAMGSNATIILPLGTTTVTLIVYDGQFSDADTVDVTVVDTAAPTIHSVSANPNVLWPPNHKMVEVIVDVDAEDDCDADPFCMITEVTCNEPINGPGDGSTEPDWECTDDPLVVLLRAERAGGGSGRVYTIHVVCEDASGNITAATVDVIVPHDQGKEKKK